ncbi:unnamed protein product [Agarophyton chilense]
MPNRTELCIVRTDPRVERQPSGQTEALPRRRSNGICRDGYTWAFAKVDLRETDTVSIDRMKRAPSSFGQPKSQPPGPMEAPRPQVDAKVCIPPKELPGDSTSPTDTIVNSNYYDPLLPTDSDGFASLNHSLLLEDEHQPEYVIERIISAGRGEDGTIRYRVRWFGYTPEEATWQKPQTILAIFIARYWRRIGHSERVHLVPIDPVGHPE